MKPEIASFLASLEAFEPERDDSATASLYSMIDPIENDQEIVEALPRIFSFLEKHPEADLGAPGPLVHLIEGFPGKYEDLLAASVRSAPGVTTVAMMNRILNSDLSDRDRALWILSLREVAESPNGSALVRSHAADFLKYQEE